jgi:hypothetical protein
MNPVRIERSIANDIQDGNDIEDGNDIQDGHDTQDLGPL